MSVIESIESLKRDMAEITKAMHEKVEKGQNEYKELTDKLIEVQKELSDRKAIFETEKDKGVGEVTPEVQRKSDELFIASRLVVSKENNFNATLYKNIQDHSEYKGAVEVIKASGLTFGGQNVGTPADGGITVPTGWSSQLLREIYLNLKIAALFPRFNMPNSTFKFPFLLNRIKARKAAEATAPTKDKAEFTDLTFTAKKLMANLELTDELDQDSILAVLPLLREELVKGFALAQEDMCFNGDTTTGAGNINGNISGADAEDARLTQNGIRKLIGSTSAQTVDFSSGGFSADNLRSLRTKMGKYGILPSELCYIINVKDYNKCLGFSGYQFLYQYGDGSVVKTGELGRIDGIPLIVSELVPDTGLDTLGFAVGGGTKATCVLVNTKSYMWGDRKEFGLETFRYPFNQTLNLIGSQRLDFQKMTSSTATPAAAGVNYTA